MKKISFLFTILCLSITVFAQSTHYIVTGKVIDAQTKQPMQAASVFSQNTTIGTATTPEGNFKLELPNGGYDLVVTFTGYNTETRRITTADASNPNIVIEIKQKEKELQDVVVRSTNEVTDGWQKYGDFFLENFIGKTNNGKQCTIKNPDALKFYFYKRKNRLKILATAPLEIVNNALGYSIKYTLDSFTHEYKTQVSQYTGYPLFEEMQTDDASLKLKWETNRQQAYNGSILHFMRSLYQKRLVEEGFEIQFLINANGKETAIPVKSFYGGLNYTMDESNGILGIIPNQTDVAVLYKNEQPSASYLEANPEAATGFELSVLNFAPNETINIERNGYYYDQNDITFNSYWAWEKVGDMVPYNYNISNEKTELINKPVPVAPAETISISPAEPIAGIVWQVDESRVMEGNKLSSYKRGASGNTINMDDDSYRFHADHTGIYFKNGEQINFTWKYTDTEKTRMEMIINYPVPVTVNLENISITATSLKYTRFQNVNGIYLMATETRKAK